jgi:plasmid stabilization system protein ParE
MTFKIRFTQEALADLERPYEFSLTRDDGDRSTAELALDAIRGGLGLLGSSPFSWREATQDDTFLRKLIIAFGVSGYVALFEIDAAKTVTVLVVRYQREDDYH